MNKLSVVRAALWASALIASPALAQDLSGADRPKVVFNEVERGLYTGAEVGFLLLEAPGLNKGLGTGSVVGLHLGYDFSEYFGLGFFGLMASVVAPSGYGGLGDGTAQGDFTGVLPGVEARLHLPVAKDQNDVSRVYVDFGLGGGLMFLQPRGLFPSNGQAPAGKLDIAVEYFTRLRHFSFGVALQGLAAFPTSTASQSGQLLGGALSPFVRYSF